VAHCRFIASSRGEGVASASCQRHMPSANDSIRLRRRFPYLASCAVYRLIDGTLVRACIRAWDYLSPLKRTGEGLARRGGGGGGRRKYRMSPWTRVYAIDQRQAPRRLMRRRRGRWIKLKNSPTEDRAPADRPHAGRKLSVKVPRGNRERMLRSMEAVSAPPARRQKKKTADKRKTDNSKAGFSRNNSVMSLER
jgi:hypothetical protein